MKFGTPEIVAFLAIITLLIACARIVGAICRRFGVPAVIGELGAGIIIGPTVFARVFPDAYAAIFATSAPAGMALSALLTLCSIFLLFVVGLEIKVTEMKTEKKPIAYLGLLGIIIPLIFGLAAGYYFIDHVPEGVAPAGFIVVLAAAFAVSALPVIARILLDLNLLKSKIGTIIIGSAAVNDVAGWLIFIFALGLAGTTHEEVPLAVSAASAILLSVLAVTYLPKVLDKAISTVGVWINSKATAEGVVVLPLLFGLSMVTEHIGLHALFGAFVLGVALSESREFHGALRESIEVMNAALFAPLYFVAVGLKADFMAGFDLFLILAILILAFGSKMLAARIGGKLAGLTNNEATAAGFGLAARGGMGIILASVAFGAGVIALPMFEALVVMAVVTSFTAALIPRFLKKDSAG
jgi:Kef-type K+ transport system membrane component KefB